MNTKLCCKICLENYNVNNRKPMILMMCCHTICVRCLDELSKHQQTNFNCPICREKVYDFKPSYDVIELLEDLENHQNSPKIVETKKSLVKNRQSNIKESLFLIKCKKYGEYLDGSLSNHMSSIESGNISDWIKWKLIPNDDGYYFIQCKQHGGYLDGGSMHIRPFEKGTNNSDWIKWKLIANGDGYHFIQCKKHGGYLDGGLKHIRSSENSGSNSGWISWKLVQ